MSFERVELAPDCIIYRGDCLEVLPTLAPGSVDAVVTDPPYGIGLKYATYIDSEESWFQLIDTVVPMCRRLARVVVMPSCAIKRIGWWYEHHRPDWLIAWYKGSPGHRSAIGFNDWEPHVVWGRPLRPMHDHFQTVCGFDDNEHPCPKPVAWAKWLVERVADDEDIVLDPFMGSGTTGVACIHTGRKFIGIEIDPGYFEIARERLQKELDLRAGTGPLMKANLLEAQP